jgi:hypothetical protein
MRGAAAPLEAPRAIGRLDPAGPWIGFAFRHGACRLVVAGDGPIREAAADDDLVIALAIAYFTQAFGDAPPDLEATQSDLSALVRQLMGTESDPRRRALLGEAVDAIDDGLAGDAVAEKLAAARAGRDDSPDPVEMLLARARELAGGG